jgi:hypothetical protein
MDEIQLLRTLDPVTAEKLDAFSAPEVFAKLSAQLADVPAGAARTPHLPGKPWAAGVSVAGAGWRCVRWRRL